MAREIVFKMERPGLVEEGQEVEVSESVTPFNVNYMIEPAVAMSGLFKLNNRLKTENGMTKGIVKKSRKMTEVSISRLYLKMSKTFTIMADFVIKSKIM